MESATSKVGTATDQLLLYCYHYDPQTGNYGFVAMRAVRVGGAHRVGRALDDLAVLAAAS